MGDREAGVDLWVERTDGTSEAQQCKAGNGSKSTWSVADLRRRGILGHARNQLEHHPNNRYSLVSSVIPVLLNDLTRSARDSGGDSESYFRDQIVAVGEDRKKEFDDFCTALGLVSTSPADRATAYQLLRRISFHQFSDDYEGREELRVLARMLVAGDPDVVIAVLADFAQQNLRKRITTLDLTAHLTATGLQLKRLILDHRVSVKISALYDEFMNSIEPKLAGGQLIQRRETTGLISLLHATDSPAVIVIHGNPGVGKSGVLFELATLLKAAGTRLIAFRLDRHIPRGNATLFGQDLGLPDSPVLCISETLISERGVIIVDQLDALRWTSSHSAEGLSVCEELIRQTVALRAQGRSVAIVIACRTFDLQQDPLLKTLFAASARFRVEKIEVRELEQSVVVSTARHLGIEVDRLTPRRLSLLQSVQNLAMWIEVVRSESRTPEFDSATGLMREFWKNRRRELEERGISATDRDAALNRIVDHMEQSTALVAPARLLHNNERLTTELQTLGVISISGAQVSFGHQSYLDFLVADRVVQQFDSSETPVHNWLGDRTKQSLFRREQLRQVLILLADEGPVAFVETCRALLSSPHIRFHLKHLILQVLGQVPVHGSVLAYVIELLADTNWSGHVIQTVLYGNRGLIRGLLDQTLITGWLGNGVAEEENNAIWLINSIIQSDPELAVAVLKPLLERGGDWPTRVDRCIYSSNPAEDTQELFSLRLECVRIVAESLYVEWEKLAKADPTRTIRLFAACLSQLVPKSGNQRRSTLEINGHKDMIAVTRAAALRPRLTWRLVGHLFTSQVQLRRTDRRRRMEAETYDYQARVRIPIVLIRVAQRALRAMARRHPRDFLLLARSLSRIRSPLVRRSLTEAYRSLPTSYADIAINWLIADDRRLQCGNRQREAKWMPARRLVERMSPHCSLEVYCRVEQKLLSFRDPDERRLARSWLSGIRYGRFDNHFGAAQCILLPGLCPGRRSHECIGRIGVLERKFGTASAKLFIAPRGQGGFVTSPLNKEKLTRFSDKTWLAIINNPRTRQRPRERFFSTHVIETSVETLSRDLGIAALRDPSRFGKLLLTLPPATPPDYFAAILEALSHEEAPSEIPEGDRREWTRASKAIVEAVLCSPHIDVTHRYLAYRFCWVLAKCGGIDYSPAVIQRLIDCCSHSDPEFDELIIGCDKKASDCPIGDLEGNVFSCVRAVAAFAISQMLFRNRDLLATLQSAITDLWSDPHPVVRLAAIRICLPIWNVNRRVAVDGFLLAAGSDIRLSACSTSREFINYAFTEYQAELTPVISAMLNSSDIDVLKAGAAQITARHLFHSCFADLFQQCLTGSEPLRTGVAEVIAELSLKPEYATECHRFLPQLFNDDSDVVRQAASSIVRNTNVLARPDACQILDTFMMSKSFSDDSADPILLLSEYKGSLKPFAAVIVKFATLITAHDPAAVGEKQWDRHFAIQHITPLLLKLYEECEGRDGVSIRQQCLDAWDSLFEQRMGIVAQLTKGLDG